MIRLLRYKIELWIWFVGTLVGQLLFDLIRAA